MHLSSIDLNLLVVLDALLATRSVKEAAQRLALSPSATSHALSRLREVFGDAILVRAGRRLVPSARGQALQAQLRPVIDSLEGLLRGAEQLEVSRLERSFRIAATDYTERFPFRELSRRVAALAPRVQLITRSFASEARDEIRAGTIDLALGPARGLPDDIHREALFEETFVCLLRGDHPLARKRLTARRFAAFDHVLVAPRGGPRGVVDRALATHGLKRQVTRIVSTFAMAPQLVADSDCITTVPSRLAEVHAERLGLTVLKPPIEVPGFTVTQMWHQRHDADPAHCWLRQQLREAARGGGRVGGA